MNLFLIRHADAEANENDSIRPLSAFGREQVAQLVATFQRDPRFQPEEIWHSSLLRAKQTAEWLKTGLGLAAPLILTHGITPDDDPRKIIGRLEQLQRPVVLVGHEPFLGALATFLVKPSGAPAYFAFHKGEVLALRRHEPKWVVAWRVLPTSHGN